MSEVDTAESAGAERAGTGTGTDVGAPAAACRIVVLGSPGSGKTTLTRALAERTRLPTYHLDDEYWHEDWSRTEPGEWERRQKELCSEPRWIIEGNYLPTIPLRAARADLVVLLDAPTALCLLRVLRRALRIRRGRFGELPARVRAQAESGARVRATKDLRSLLVLVARFRGRTWWPAVAAARTGPHARLVIAVAPATSKRRIRTLRTRLERRGVPAAVLPAAAIVHLAGGDRPEPTRGT